MKKCKEIQLVQNPPNHPKHTGSFSDSVVLGSRNCRSYRGEVFRTCFAPRNRNIASRGLKLVLSLAAGSLLPARKRIGTSVCYAPEWSNDDDDDDWQKHSICIKKFLIKIN